SGEVQVVGDGHEVARGPRGLEPSRGVREQHAPHAYARHRADALDDLADGVPLVQVHAALHAHHGDALDVAEAEVARVPLDRRGGHVRQVAVGDLDQAVEPLGEGAQTATED